MLTLADSHCSLARPSEDLVIALCNMTAFTSPGTDASGTSGSLHGTPLHMQIIPGFNSSSRPTTTSLLPISSNTINNSKRKRRPAGTPDPDAEVVALSPKTLMESDRYVCEICNQGFQRDQNLQMHRRRHKVPWKLLKRASPEVRKRVYVCPDPTCLHNDPCHALGDLVGIKKHFRRKHSVEKQWKCEKCSKGYAVQSDYKAHLKTCGTRGHSCDCGRVFSRVESFIEHQDNCNAAKERATFGYGDPPRLPSLTVRTTSSNEGLSATMSGLSSAGRPLESCKFQEQAWLNTEQQRELQFLPTKNHSNTLNTRIQGPANVGSAILIRENLRIPTASPRPNFSTGTEYRYSHIRSSTAEEEDMLDSAPELQLSIGLSNHNNKKKNPAVITRQTSNGNTFSSPEDDFRSRKLADHYEALKLINGRESLAKGNNVFGDHSSDKNTKVWSGLVETPTDNMMLLRQGSSEVTVGESSFLNHPWKSFIPSHFQALPPANKQISSSIHNERVERTEPVRPWFANGLANKEGDEAQSDMAGAECLKRQAWENLRHATDEEAYAEQARDMAKKQIELAEAEFATAKKIKERARAQLAHAQLLKEQATRRIDETRFEITCQACRQKFLYHILPSNGENHNNCSNSSVLQLQFMPEYSSTFLQNELKGEL